MAIKVPKKPKLWPKNCIFMTKAIYEAIFNGTMLEGGYNGTKGINAEKFRLFASLQMSQIWSQEGQKVACK